MSTAISLDPASSDSFIVALSGVSASSYRVRSVQIFTGDLRSSYCFRAGRSIESVFAPEFSRSFLDVLRAQTLEDGAVEIPEFSAVAPGLGVSGLRIEPAQVGDEPGSLTLHFDRYVGDIKRVLRFLPSEELKPATVRERIAVEVLRDIVSPIFDLMSLAQPSSRDILKSHSGEVEARLSRLAAHQEEIKFFTGLLNRYVAGCQQDAAELGADPTDGLWPTKRHSAGR